MPIVVFFKATLRIMKKSISKCIPVVVIGAGGTGLYMADCIDRTKGFSFVGFLDDDKRKQTSGYNNRLVLGSLNSWEELDYRFYFINSLYSAKKMKNFRSTVQSLEIPNERWTTIIDSMTRVCSDVKIGRGSFVGPGSIIEPASMIGEKCVLLGNVYIAHHTKIEDYVACANSVSIAGGVHIGEGAYVGANATVHQYVRVGAFATIGMGAVVLRSVKEEETVVGNPAKPVSLSLPLES